MWPSLSKWVLSTWHSPKTFSDTFSKSLDHKFPNHPTVLWGRSNREPLTQWLQHERQQNGFLPRTVADGLSFSNIFSLSKHKCTIGKWSRETIPRIEEHSWCWTLAAFKSNPIALYVSGVSCVTSLKPSLTHQPHLSFMPSLDPVLHRSRPACPHPLASVFMSLTTQQTRRWE